MLNLYQFFLIVVSTKHISIENYHRELCRMNLEEREKAKEVLRPILTQPDYVMEPGCHATVRKYMKLCKNPEKEAKDVIIMLTDNYAAIAQVNEN